MAFLEVVVWVEVVVQVPEGWLIGWWWLVGFKLVGWRTKTSGWYPRSGLDLGVVKVGCDHWVPFW